MGSFAGFNDVTGDLVVREVAPHRDGPATIGAGH